MSTDIRVGQLGCGAIASAQHLGALRRIPGAKLVAAADPDDAARASVAAAGVEVLEGSDELLARVDIDAIVIAAPTHLHATLAIACAAAGKHFYLEKPIATTAADGISVVGAAERSGIVGAVGFNRRFHPLCVQARRVVREGRIGRVRIAHTVFSEPMDVARLPAWRRARATGGGVLLDLASHHFDLLRWLLDDDLSVIASTVRSDASEHDTAGVALATANGTDVRCTFSYTAGYADFVELIGERGTLRIDRHLPRLDLRLGRRSRYGVRRVPIRPDRDVLAWRIRRLAARGDEPSYRNALHAFVRQIQTGEPLVATLADGLCSLQTVLAAEQMAGTGLAR